MVQHPAVTFQIDTGSSANILPLQDYFRVRKDNSKANIVAKEILLIVHDHSKRKVLGSVMLKVEHKGNKHELYFVSKLIGKCFNKFPTGLGYF